MGYKKEISRTINILIFCTIVFAGCKKKDDDKAITPAATTPCVAAGNSSSSTITGFDRPVGIAFSPAQKVAVTEFHGMDFDGNNYTYGQLGPVKIFLNTTNFYANTPDLTITTTYAPEAVLFDANENLYITETENISGVSIYQPPYTTLLKTIQNGFQNPRGIAIDGSGNLYLAEDDLNRVLKISDPLGIESQATFITGLSAPKAIVISGNYMFIAEYTANRVSKYNINTPATPVETYTIDQPIDLHVSGCMLYISSHGTTAGGYGTSKVVAVKMDNMAAGIQKEYTGFTGITFGVSSDQNGNIFVSDFSTGEIRKYAK